MASIRIPVSLKFDEESSFYAEFISDLRTDRKLTDLITDLLRLYYEDEQLRGVINLRLESNNEFAEVYSQLDKIQMHHNKTMMATAMLANQSKGIIRTMEQDGMLDPNIGLGSQPDNQTYTMNIGGQPQPTAEQSQQLLGQQQQPQQPQQTPQQPDALAGLVKRMEAVEQMMPMLTRITQLLESGQVPSMQVVQQSQPTVQPHQQVSQSEQAYSTAFTQPTQPQVLQQEPVATPVFTPTMEPVVEQVQPVMQQVPQAIMEQPVIMPTETSVAPTLATAPTFESTPQVESAPTPSSVGGTGLSPAQEQEKKPTSFNKAFAAMKKKS